MLGMDEGEEREYGEYGEYVVGEIVWAKEAGPGSSVAC